MSAPTSYSEALVQAASLYAAATVSPDAGEVVRVMAENTISRRESAAEWAINLIEESWVFIDPYDGAQVQSFAHKAAQVMRSAQTVVSRVTAAAQTRQFAAMGVSVPALLPSAPVDVRASAVDITGGVVDLDHDRIVVDYDSGRGQVRDVSTEDIFNRPAREFRYRKSIGDNNADESARGRVRTLVHDNLMLAQRIAEAESIAQAADLDRSVIGYRRIIHPELSRGGVCGMCIVAADRVYEVSELKPIHRNCKCTVAAVTQDFDPASVNSADLEHFYEDAQGNTVRDLKRTRYKVDEHGELGAVLVPRA